MKRRHFLQSGAVALASTRLQNLARAAGRREFVLENSQIAWRLTAGPDGIHSTIFENRLSGHVYNLQADDEFTLVFATGGQRLEIPWWHFQLTDGGDSAPEREKGLNQGFHKRDLSTANWTAVNNLAGGQKGRIYPGYGWFRHTFSLPETARGRDLVFVLGGYDEQDWNEHWVYLNGAEIGHRTISTRWRLPGRYTVRAADAAYAALQFGPQSRNLLAIRARGYDYHLGGLSDEALVQYVFRPFLFDQFVSIGEPYLPVSRFACARRTRTIHKL
jgi:hypothetical protein